jgi:hypothetical protein
MRGTKFQANKKLQGKIVLLCTLIFTRLDIRREDKNDFELNSIKHFLSSSAFFAKIILICYSRSQIFALYHITEKFISQRQ